MEHFTLSEMLHGAARNASQESADVVPQGKEAVTPGTTPFLVDS